jgi:hypothetical protein
MWWNQFRASGAFTFNTLGNYYKTSSDEDWSFIEYCGLYYLFFSPKKKSFLYS